MLWHSVGTISLNNRASAQCLQGVPRLKSNHVEPLFGLAKVVRRLGPRRCLILRLTTFINWVASTGI